MVSTDELLDGFQQFKKQYFGDDSHLYDSMKNGQPAKTLMIACCDSRVDPAILTNCEPGDIFTIRNVANLVPPCEDNDHHHATSAAIEYAVNALEVENIIIMGHANCGGIKALWDGTSEPTQFIESWMSSAQPAKEKVQKKLPEASHSDKIKSCEQQSVLVSLENLVTFPFIKERVEKGLLSLHGWYFDLTEGELLSYNPDSDEFEVVTA